MIGFMNEADAWQALSALRTALWKYNLQLNDDKTKITHSQLVFREKWQLEFDDITVSNTHPFNQVRDIQRLVDLTLNFFAETKTGTPAVWACRRLSSTIGSTSRKSSMLYSGWRGIFPFAYLTSPYS